jgi:hypothetical protein
MAFHLISLLFVIAATCDASASVAMNVSGVSAASLPAIATNASGGKTSFATPVNASAKASGASVALRGSAAVTMSPAEDAASPIVAGDLNVTASSSASSSTGLCVDSGLFTDEKGFHCSDWHDYICSSRDMSYWGYSNAGAKAVRLFCKHTCGTCTGRTFAPLDNGIFVDEKGRHCKDFWGHGCTDAVFSAWEYSLAGAAGVIAFCKYTCGVCIDADGYRCRTSGGLSPSTSPSPSLCLDDGDWKDATGYSCSSWGFWGCTAESFSGWGISKQNALAILEHCPYSCGRC